MLGTSPFIGAGQFGVKAAEYYLNFYLNPKRIAEVYREAYELGVKALQLVVCEPTVKALEEAKVDFYIAASIFGNFDKGLKMIEKFSPEIVAIHAEIADSLNHQKIIKCLAAIKRIKVIPAVATHNPGVTIPWIDRLKEFEVYFAPLNKLGLFMEPNAELALKALKESKAKIAAIKPLAAGKLKPKEALPYIYKHAESACVGMTNRREILEVLEAV
jgi:hypothetical protein